MDRLRMAESQPRLETASTGGSRLHGSATVWVVVLVLPVLIVALGVALEALGLIARIV